MRQPPCVVIYGRNRGLLETRSLVLKVAGFKVSTTSDPGEAARHIRTDRIELLILCHTLSAKECASILASARFFEPRLKVLVLNTVHSGCESHEAAVLNTFAGPQALLLAAHKLLEIPAAA